MNEKVLKVEQIIDNLKKVLQFHTDTQLAKYLGINQTTLSSWKRTNNFDVYKVYEQIKSINLAWLFTGEGEPFVGSTIQENENTFQTRIAELLEVIKINDANIRMNASKITHINLEIELLRAKLATIERLLNLIQ